MNTKLAQLAYFVNKIDRRYLRLAYFAVMLAVSVILKRPTDGGSDPY